MRDGAGDCGYALFDTPVGRCGIAWTSRGIAAVQLPEPTDERTRARLRARLASVTEAPPIPPVGEAIERIVALLVGDAEDLADIELDMEGVPPFCRRVYDAARSIPPGSTVTYGALAARTGAPGAARAVGQALGRNPFAMVVPCHRVVAAGGKLGGFSASGGATTKAVILTAEGWTPGRPQRRATPVLAFDPIAWRLGRPDVPPVEDLGVRKSSNTVSGGPGSSGDEKERRGKR